MLHYNKETMNYDAADRHVNFDSRVTEEDCRTIDTIESFASTSQFNNLNKADPLIKINDIEKQPTHVAKILKKFLKGDWEVD